MRDPVITISPDGVGWVGAACAGAWVTSAGGSVLCACAADAAAVIATKATLARKAVSIRFIRIPLYGRPEPNSVVAKEGMLTHVMGARKPQPSRMRHNCRGVMYFVYTSRGAGSDKWASRRTSRRPRVTVSRIRPAKKHSTAMI